MTLTFGLELDDSAAPLPAQSCGVYYCGKKKLLAILETHLGLTGHPDDIEYLRIEQYRQALLRHTAYCLLPTANCQPPFFLRSFEADQFAAATALLARRDELVLAGWGFEITEDLPPRLATLAQIEQIFGETHSEDDAEPLQLSPGFADRFRLVLEKLDERAHPFTAIFLNEPFDLLPCHFRRLLKKLSETAAKPAFTQLFEMRNAECGIRNAAAETDLQAFQRILSSPQTSHALTLSPSHPLTLSRSHALTLSPSHALTLSPSHALTFSPSHALKNDGSLLLLCAKRPDEAAAWLAKWLRLNKVKPTFLISEKNTTFDLALVQEGLPSLGIQSASLARPTLQILKLASVFLWEPINPFKILEFVSLSVKPLPDDLATLIANQVARMPGLQGEGWYAMIGSYFDGLENSEEAPGDAPKSKQRTSPKEARRQYNFWFERKRYDMDKVAPKRDALEIFAYLREWALGAFEDGNGKNHSLIVLAEQSKRIVELLQALPETELTFLELERIVRTIYQPSPVVLQEREAGGSPFVTHPAALLGEVDELVWWNFTQNEQPHFFARWYEPERQYLAPLGVEPDTPRQENARMLWQQQRPFLLAKKRLLLVLPQTVNAEEAVPHPLFGDLQAAFGNLDRITQSAVGSGQSAVGSPQSEMGSLPFGKHFKLPGFVEIEPQRLGKPQPFLQVRNLEKLRREHESLTSLEALFYYPYQWFFKYKIKLNKSSILSVVKDNALMGNLSHRVFEKLLKEDLQALDKPALERWIDAEARRLMSREGAVLLMYGREPERIAFVNKLKFAAWSLVSHIRDNGWRVVQTEMDLTGTFPDSVPHPSSLIPHPSTPVKGIADLVLERGGELAVIDIKWSGSARREATLRNGEDLQLVLYTRLLEPLETWHHSAYFIIENGKLIARNNLAFQRATAVAPAEDFRVLKEKILRSMEATWRWRMAQLGEGQIEIRCRQTLHFIEEAYNEGGHGELMMEILEMKGEDARFDDYRTLINLVE